MGKASGKLKSWLNGLNISRKLLLILVLVSVIPITSTLLIYYRETTRTLRDQINQLANQDIRQSGSSFETFLNTCDSILLDLYTNDTIAENVNYINVWDSQRYFSAINIVRTQLKNTVFSKSDVLGVAIVALNGETVYYDRVTQSTVDSYCLDVGNVLNSELYRRAIQTSGPVYGGTQTVRSESYGTKNIFHISRRLMDLKNLKQGAIGTVILSIDAGSIQQSCLRDSGKPVNATFITDREGNVISYPIEEYVGQNIYGASGDRNDFHSALETFIRHTGLVGSRHLMINSLPVESGSFAVVNVQNEDYALKDVRRISVLIVMIGIGAVLLALFIILTISRSVDHSVKTIITAMRLANQGDLSVQIKASGTDEFAQISRNFNEMIMEMKKLMDKRHEAMVRKNEAEIRALEAQINPHFLYNTLDAINWMAIENEEYSISRMLKNLALILRYSVDKSNEIVTLAEELEYLKKYIRLQKVRYNYSFECILTVPEDALSCKIHKLLIQPLVENTLVHGFPGNTGRDRIEIHVCCEEKRFLCILLSDNGSGMDAELMDCFNHYDAEKEDRGSSIGIRNVISRIKMYYGDKGSFTVMPGEKNGVRIRLRIPFEQ